MHDGARAVQFLRSKAREWNLNPKAFAASGGSAGTGMSLWIGFHDDMADAASSDLVKRQSTRLPPDHPAGRDGTSRAASARRGAGPAGRDQRSIGAQFARNAVRA